MREQLRARFGAVRDRDPLRARPGEICGTQFDHLAGANEEHALVRHPLENALGKMHRRRRHRHDVRPDRRRRAHFLRDGKSVLEQFVQQRAHRPSLFGTAGSVLHLTEDLRLAEDHRVEPARDAKDMPDRIALRIGIEIRRDFAQRQVMKTRQPVGSVLRLLRGEVQFGAIAGRQDRRLAHRPLVRQIMQRVVQALGLKRHLLANRERRRMVIQAKSIKLHARSQGSVMPRIITLRETAKD